mgnify:CR=1 FL=1
MYAIVEIKGKQYKVEKDTTINVDKLDDNTEEITLDKVLLVSKDGEVKIGNPYIANASIKAKVIGNVQGRKVRGIKFKKRKNYTRTVGHRHLYSQIKINDLNI